MLSDALVFSKRNIFDAFLQLHDILEISPSLGYVRLHKASKITYESIIIVLIDNKYIFDKFLVPLCGKKCKKF